MGFTCERKLNSIIAWSIRLPRVDPHGRWIRGEAIPCQASVFIRDNSSLDGDDVLCKCDTWRASLGFNENCFMIFKWMLESSTLEAIAILRRDLFFLRKSRKIKPSQMLKIKKVKLRKQSRQRCCWETIRDL